MAQTKKKPTGPKASGRTVAGDSRPVPTEEEIGERIQATRSGSASSGQMSRHVRWQSIFRVSSPQVVTSARRASAGFMSRLAVRH